MIKLLDILKEAKIIPSSTQHDLWKILNIFKKENTYYKIIYYEITALYLPTNYTVTGTYFPEDEKLKFWVPKEDIKNNPLFHKGLLESGFTLIERDWYSVDFKAPSSFIQKYIKPNLNRPYTPIPVKKEKKPTGVAVGRRKSLFKEASKIDKQ